MSEEAWYKMLVASLILHIIVVGIFSITIKSKPKRLDLSGAYSANLVGSVGTGGGASKGGGRTVTPTPTIKKPPEKPTPTQKKETIASRKPVPVKTEKEAVSITKSKKKTPVKETPETNDGKTTKEELDRLNARLKNIRKKTEYMDLAKGGGSGSGHGEGGLPFSGSGAGAPLDPLMQKYLLDVFDKIKSVWQVPTIAKGNLETVVVIKIRKDGIITDINIEKRSGNRYFDESIRRALSAAEPLPKIPITLGTDSVEVGFIFRPEGMS